jgi:hypothetical protein
MSLKPLAALGLLLLVGCGPNGPTPTPTPGEFGTFSGTVKTEWIAGSREMELLDDFTYIGPDMVEWKCPKGSKIDGASIPQFLWTAVGSPYTGLYRNASVPHDIACDKKERSSDDVHLMFYNACRCGGCSETEAKVLYAGVLLGGPKWAVGGAPIPVVYKTTNVFEDDFEDAKADIEARNPSLDEIKTRAKHGTFPKRPPELRTSRPVDLRGDRLIRRIPTTRIR